MNSLFVELNPSSWEDAKKIRRHLSDWIFRGHGSKDWKLETNIERAVKQFGCSRELISIREKMLIHDFQQRAHHYLQSPPDKEDLIEWLALVQHHGGPTRLLDFTESFYIASYFAIEKTTDDASVWAVNARYLWNKISQKIECDFTSEQTLVEQQEIALRYAESFLTDRAKRQDCVIGVKPMRLNQRMAIQKGIFLFPCNMEISFEENLCKSFELPMNSLNSENSIRMKADEFIADIENHYVVAKINYSKEWHGAVYDDLYSMNIDAASLFPGIDGFAKSLIHHIRVMEGSEKYLQRFVKKSEKAS
jgi:hypothetical protein